MANNSPVEQDLIIRAKDLTSETFVKVQAAVDHLRETMATYTKEAEKGTGGTVALRNSINDALTAFQALTGQQRALDNFANSVERVANAPGKRDAARALRDAFKESLPTDAKQQTQPQKDELKELTRLATNAAGEIVRAKKSLESSSARLKTLGIEPEGVAAARVQVTESLLQIRTSIIEAEKANENYAKASAAVRAADKATADQKKALAKAASDAAKEAAKADEEVVAAAKRRSSLLIEISNQEFKDKKALDDRVASDRVRAEKENEELDKFRALAFQRIRDTKVAQQDRPAQLTPSDDATKAVQSLIAPTATARSSLQGLEAEVQKLSEALSVNKLKAHDATEGLRSLAGAQSEIQRQAAIIDRVRNEGAAYEAAAQHARGFGEQLVRLGLQARSSTPDNEKLKAEIDRVGSNFDRASEAAARQAEKLAVAQTAAQKAGIDYHNLETELTRLVAITEKATVAGKKATDAGGGGGGSGGKTRYFGLRPDELADLYYRLDDTINQINLGQNAGYVFAEQGTKALKLFGQEAANLLPYLKILGPAALAVAAAFLILRNAAEQTAALRTFRAELIATNETASYTAEKLLADTVKIREYGVSFTNAREAVTEFARAGYDDSQIVRLGKAAQDMADVFGVKFPEAAKKLSEGLRGSYENVKKLNDEIGFLTPELAKEIRDLFEAGKAAEAHALAIEASSNKLKEAQASALGPFGQGLRDLKIGYGEFIEALSHTNVIQTLVIQVGELTGALGRALFALGHLKEAFQFITGGTAAQQVGALGDQAAVQARLAAARQQVAQIEATPLPGGVTNRGPAFKNLQDEIALLETKAKTLKEATSAQVGNTAATTAGTQATNAQAVATQDFLKDEQERLNRQFRPEFRRGSQEQIDADKANLELVRRDFLAKFDKDTKGAPHTDDVNKQADEEVARARDRLNEQRASEKSLQDIIAEGNDRIAQENEKGLKGQELYNSRLNRIKAERIKDEEKFRRAYRVAQDAPTPPELTDLLNREQASREAGAQRQLDNEKQKGGSTGATAGESAALLLSRLQQELDNKDKTNLDAKLRAVEEKYTGLYTRLDIIARRKGADGSTIASVRAEIDTAKVREVEQVNFETREAGINKLLQDRKTLITANDDAIKSGSITAAEGFSRAAKIEESLTPQIRKLTDEAIKFAKALGGADPSPAVQAAIAKAQAARQSTEPGGGPDSGKSDTNPELAAIDAATERSQRLAKDRDTTVKAQIELEKLHLQGTEDTEAKSRAAYERTTTAIRAQTTASIANLNQLRSSNKITEDEYQQRIATLQKLNVETNFQSEFMKKLGDTIENSIANRGTAAIDQIATSFGKLITGQEKFKDVIKDVGIIFAQFAAGVLKDIALMIIKQLILAEISAVVAALTGGVSTAVGGGVSLASGGVSAGTGAVSAFDAAGVDSSAVQAHEGGTIGGSNFPMRKVDPSWFAQAPRMHSGGIVGLQANEQAAILQKGERVLTESQQRSEATSGSGGGTNVRQVLVLDPKDLSGALSGSHGEQTVITHIKNNAGAIRTILQ